MKIAHISDLHLNTFFKDSNLKGIKYLLKYALRSNADHIVITGDLTDNAKPDDFEILRNLFKSLGLLNSERLSLVIGNHDIFGGIQTPEDIFGFPEKCCQVNYESMVASFYEYFGESFDDSDFGINNKPFPFVKLINDVLFAGFNSNARYSRVKNPFASNGKINPEDLSGAENLLKPYSDKSLTKIALVHHHFNKVKLKKDSFASGFWQKLEKQTMKLKKKKKIISFFKEHNIDLVLHGHWHINMEYNREGVGFFNGGATIKGNLFDEIQINFINVEPAKIITETHKLIGNSSIIIHRNVRETNKKLTEEKIKIAANF